MVSGWVPEEGQGHEGRGADGEALADGGRGVACGVERVGLVTHRRGKLAHLRTHAREVASARGWIHLCARVCTHLHTRAILSGYVKRVSVEANRISLVHHCPSPLLRPL